MSGAESTNLLLLNQFFLNKLLADPQFPKDNHPYIQFEREYLKLVLEVNTHYNEFVKTFVQIHH